MLSLRGVKKGYESGGSHLDVLKGVDLDLGRGSMAALTGPSGVGKSTLLHLIAGLDRPEGGEITVDGMSVAGLAGAALDRYRARTVGIVYQFHFLLPEFTAEENVMIPALIIGGQEREARSRATELLDLVGISGRASHRPSQLSGGEQQRVALARALINSPPLLLADEPTGNLDEETANRVFHLIRDIGGEMSLTVLLATHNLELASRCGCEFILREGKIGVIRCPGDAGHPSGGNPLVGD